MSPVAPRSRRADAQRNRDAILGAARVLFDAEGIFAPIDRIATTAGVGNATLYRNFPTRDDLLAAVIDDTFADLMNESDELETTMSPDAALREWLQRLAWRLRIWNDLPTCIATAIDDSGSPVEDVVTRLTKRTRTLLERAHRHGTASGSVTADELVQLITSVSWGIDRFGDDREGARRRVELAIAGVFDDR